MPALAVDLAIPLGLDLRTSERLRLDSYKHSDSPGNYKLLLLNSWQYIFHEFTTSSYVKSLHFYGIFNIQFIIF